MKKHVVKKEKRMKFLNKAKRNNKGFSLIELIIVIAIMAVLVGTLAPQYIRYVEKSKLAADANTADEIVTAFEVVAATPGNGLTTDDQLIAEYDATNKKIVFKYSADNGTTKTEITKDSTATQAKVFLSLVDVSKTYTYTSSTYVSAAPTVTLKYNGTTKTWEVESTAPSIDKN